MDNKHLYAQCFTERTRICYNKKRQGSDRQMTNLCTFGWDYSKLGLLRLKRPLRPLQVSLYIVNCTP